MNKRFAFTSFIFMVLLGSVYSWSIYRDFIEKIYRLKFYESVFPYVVSLVFYAIFMSSQPFISILRKPKTVFYYGISLISFGYLISSFSQSYINLIIGYGVFVGSGVGLLYGLPLQLSKEKYLNNSNVLISIQMSGFALSPVLITPIISYSLIQIGFHNTMLSLGILVPILLYILMFIDIKQLKNQNSHSFRKYFRLIKNKRLFDTYLNLVIGTSIGLMIIGIHRKLGIHYFNITNHQLTFYLFWFALANAIGRLIMPKSVNVFGVNRMIRLIQLVPICAILILLIFKENYLAFFIGVALLWFQLGAWLSLTSIIVSQHFLGIDYKPIFAILFSAYGFGAIGGIIFEWIVNQYDVSIFYILVAVLSFINFLIFYYRKFSERKMLNNS